jgi:hypothetical protein
MNAMSARLAACRGEMMTSPEPGTDRPGIHTGRTGRRAPITASTSPAVPGGVEDLRPVQVSGQAVERPGPHYFRQPLRDIGGVNWLAGCAGQDQ